MTRTFVPPTSFVSSPGTEKERLLYQTAGVASGFYPRHECLFSDRPIPKFKGWNVIIPLFVKDFDQKYWKDAYKAGQSMPLRLSEYMGRCVRNITLNPVKMVRIEELKAQWQQKEDGFFKALNIYFPKEIKYIGSLEIRITKIGSLGSHYLLSNKNGQKLIINAREDSNIEGIASLIVLSLIWPLSGELRLSFTKRQLLRNFVMSRGEMKMIFPNWEPYEFENIKIPDSLRHKSQEYLQLLGIPKVVDPVEIIRKNISVFGKKEEKLLMELIKKKSEVVTYDEIADLIWGQGEFKSYWAINKLVQRIQKKINDLEIENLKIKGIRGRGYKL